MPYITESLLDIINQMLSDHNRIQALENILEDTDVDALISRYKKGKDTHVILEYLIEKGYTLINRPYHKELETITLFLNDVRAYSNDRYLDYPTTLFLAHLNKDVTNNITQHVALHLFFNDHVSLKSYVTSLNKSFNMDLSSHLTSIIKQAFE